MILAFGILSLLSQVILLRELGTLLRGNELVLGLLLFSWLTGNGLGCGLYRRLPAQGREQPWVPSALLFLSGALLTAMVFLIRYAFGWFQYGAQPSLLLISALAFGLTAPVSFPLGMAFASLASRWTAGRGTAAQGFAWVYLWESLGACLGGLLFTFLFLGRVDSLVVAALMALSFLPDMAFRLSAKPWQKAGTGILLPMVMLGGLALYSDKAVWLSRVLEYRNSKLLDAGESRFGSFGLVENGGLGTVYYNGAALFHSDPVAFEEAALLPALVSKTPNKILALGFCPPPLLEQINKCRPEKITVVSLDDRLVRSVQNHITTQPGQGPPPQVDYLFLDPFRWRDSVSGSYDLILVEKGLPSTMADNRFFTPFFYDGLRKGLAPGGLIALALPYEENLITAPTLRSLKIIKNTLEACFASTALLAGEQFFFFASDSPLDLNLPDISKRLARLRLSTRFLNQGYLNHYLDPGRRARYERRLDGCPVQTANRFFAMDLYWNSLKTWMTVNLGDSLPVLVILAALSLWVLARRMKPIACFFLADTHSWFLFALGFAFMVGEIQLLQFYQGVSGMVYQFFGLLTAAFMLGLSGGAGLAMAFSGKQGVRRLWDAAALVWVAGMGVCFLTQPGFVLERGLLDPLALAWNLLGGLILGAVFSAETGFLSQRLENGEVLSSKLYAFDLFGSAAAALLAPMVLIPILGQALTAGFSLLGLLLAMVFTRGARYGT